MTSDLSRKVPVTSSAKWRRRRLKHKVKGLLGFCEWGRTTFTLRYFRSAFLAAIVKPYTDSEGRVDLLLVLFLMELECAAGVPRVKISSFIYLFFICSFVSVSVWSGRKKK